ncbi:hypothetical protein RND71_008162 [Anisodus tanguticus]|uniref:Leucine-rich repeat-containing N-terminal plant-type domain-containing protein n=1 Tax=Anisodus tanguticus TaxID=243964 RepID=A0AAE1SKA3_9SOLA|nr:hypothetical protein RND71_008162 [Anisodus tanguticus]
MGPIPKFRATNATHFSNSLCRPTSGVPCAPQVNALLDLFGGWNYPANLASEWSDNDSCTCPWFGINCNPKGQVGSGLFQFRVKPEVEWLCILEQMKYEKAKEDKRQNGSGNDA